jgi:hypothetical protein
VGATVTPPLPPCVNLSGEQYVYIDKKFQYTGKTTKPNTICSYVLNATGEKVPHVDLSGEMMQVPDNVPGMLPQFEQVICEMKEAKNPGNKKKCKADNDCIDITDEAMLQKIHTCKIPGGNYYNLAKDQIRSFEYSAYADMNATINGFKRHFVTYMKRCRSNKLEVGRELLYQFMECNSVLLPMSVTEYIAEHLENNPNCADLFGLVGCHLSNYLGSIVTHYKKDNIIIII